MKATVIPTQTVRKFNFKAFVYQLNFFDNISEAKKLKKTKGTKENIQNSSDEDAEDVESEEEELVYSKSIKFIIYVNWIS